MWKNKRDRSVLGDNGFTLVEVLAAFAILLIVSQMLLLGILYSAKMKTRVDEMKAERTMIGTSVMNQENGISGTVRMEFGDDIEAIERQGWLYRGENHQKEMSEFSVIWVDEDE